MIKFHPFLYFKKQNKTRGLSIAPCPHHPSSFPTASCHVGWFELLWRERLNVNIEEVALVRNFVRLRAQRVVLQHPSGKVQDKVGRELSLHFSVEPSFTLAP